MPVLMPLAPEIKKIDATPLSTFIISAAILCGCLPRAVAQNSSSSVETLGIITAKQAVEGLGFNLDPEQDWQWAAAAQAGATHARFQCSWEQVEQQSPAPLNVPLSPQYVQTPNCLAGLAFAKKYGIHPTIAAAYGAPHHVLLNVSVPAGATIGATSIDISLVPGKSGADLTNLAVPYDYFGVLPYGRLSRVGPYYGTFITGVKVMDSRHATLNLASALTSSLPADATVYGISEVLYPSAASFGAGDPSVAAYSNYVNFLATSMASAGVTGDVELWNEPPSAALDPWDNRYAAYDTALLPAQPAFAASSQWTPNFGFVANLQARQMPSGVTATWNGTSGDGSSSILGSSMLNHSGVSAVQPATVVTTESFHPYGGPYNNPEDVLWQQSCLSAAAAIGSFNTCTLAGERAGPNNIFEAFLDATAKARNATLGVGRSVTETNVLPPHPNMAMQQARFDVRQFLGLQADGFTPVEFYKLYDAGTPTDPNFSFVQQIGNTASYTKKQNYIAISGLMAALANISQPPVQPYPTTSLAAVTSYFGTYPLSTVHLVGAKSGATANSDLLVLWQRSVTPCSGTTCSGDWMTLASPKPGLATVSLPSGTNVVSAIDLVTGSPVPYTSVLGVVTVLGVTDDPLALMIEPAASILVGNTLQTYTGLPLPVSVSTVPHGLPTITTYNGSSKAPTEAKSYAVVSKTTDAHHILVGASATLVIAKATPTLAWEPERTARQGVPLGRRVLNATCSVPGNITYTAAIPGGWATFLNLDTALPAGRYNVQAKCLPANTSDFTEAVSLVVLQVAGPDR